MNRRHSVIALAALAAVLAATAISASAGPASAGRGIATRSYVQTNLVSDIPGLAAHTDPNLKNPWGTSVGPGSPIWVSDNHAGVTTLYDGSGNPQPRVVTIPAPPSAGAGAVGAPTGQAFNTFDNTSADFVISKAGVSGPAFFLFATAVPVVPLMIRISSSNRAFARRRRSAGARRARRCSCRSM